MGESSEAKIAGMLQEGLEFYGAGDFSRAFLTWNEVLELDPDNEEALDYLRDADRRSKPRDGAFEGARRSPVDEARGLLRSEDAESALEYLMSARTDGRLDCEAMAELLRASLFTQYQEELGDLSRVPRVVGGSESQFRNRNLPASAGFLLSMIDGETQVSDLVSVSAMDPFETMRSLSCMFKADILEWVE
jgi:hypothetical protein